MRHIRLVQSLILALLLGACADPTYAPVRPDVSRLGDAQGVIVVTNRARNPDGFFGSSRSAAMSYLAVTVSVPRDRDMGDIPVSIRHAVPGQHFMISDSRTLAGGAGDFRAGLRRDLAALPADERDVLIYVHGYNNSYSDGVFRTAQLMHDFGLKGVAVHFSWPSAAHPLGYSHDRDSLLFARDGLEAMLRDVGQVGARNVVLIGHSLGAMLVMETMRQMDIAQHGLPDRIIDGVVLISPDIDIDLFRTQAYRITSLPEPFAIFTSQKDRALQLSNLVNGKSERLGAVAQADELADLNVTVVDVTAFTGKASTSHFTAGSSPALIALLSQGQVLDRTFALPNRAARGGLPGVVVTVRNATQVILSPGLLRY